MIIMKNWLNDSGLCIVEIRQDENIAIPDTLELIDERLYGLARILFLRRK